MDNELQTVKEFVKEQKVNYTILHDPNGQKVGSLYKVRSIPQTYIIDRKGVIRYVHVGFREGDAEKIEKQIKTLLEEK